MTPPIDWTHAKAPDLDAFEAIAHAAYAALPEQGKRVDELALRLFIDPESLRGDEHGVRVRAPAGNPVLGDDELLTGPGGGSRVTSGTFAVAVLDEIHDPKHSRRRFTVRDEDC